MIMAKISMKNKYSLRNGDIKIGDVAGKGFAHLVSSLAKQAFSKMALRIKIIAV